MDTHEYDSVSFNDDAAIKLESALREEIDKVIDVWFDYLTVVEKAEVTLDKFKQDLLNVLEINSNDFYDKDIDAMILEGDLTEEQDIDFYLWAILHVYRHMIWCIYEHGFQPSLTWEVYRGVKLCESVRVKTRRMIEEQRHLRLRMKDLSQKRHEETRKKDTQTKDKIKKIWLSHNWATYTECADHIHQNALVDESNYRKIYSLVSKAAKEKS